MPESNSPWPEEFIEFPYAISELLDDFIVLGDFTFMVLVRSDTPENLKQNLMAAAKAHNLGLQSIDYVLKRYGPWQPVNRQSQIEAHTKDMLDKSLEEVEKVIDRLASVKK